MMKRAAALLILASTLSIAVHADPPVSDPWVAVSFLLGTWHAQTGEGSSAKVLGSYLFQKELNGHIIARHAAVSECSGPANFDCQHGDLLYLFQDAPGQALKAIYFDNEGHVIHYAVSSPDASTVEFRSEAAPGPRFRLYYHLERGVLTGKFQSQMPGHDDWKSYLEWSGPKE